MDTANAGGGGALPLANVDPEAERLAERRRLIAHTVMVLSGKGGVGKSTVAANLAVALAGAGKRTGLLDIDIHGPSIPKILGLEGAPLSGPAEVLLPVRFNDRLEVMSIGFLLHDRSDAVIWRGPMKHKVIQQFLTDVEWGSLDYLVVDSPPGTGDEPLSIAQLMRGADGAVVVTTPQDVAVADVRRCIQFCRRVELPVLGVIENMSGFVCPTCGTEVALFKRGGGESLAQEMGVPFLGRIPIDPAVVEACDAGRPVTGPGAEAPAARAFRRVAEVILQRDVILPAGSGPASGEGGRS